MYIYIYTLFYLSIYLPNMLKFLKSRIRKGAIFALFAFFIRRSLGTFFFTSRPPTPLEVFGSPSCCSLQLIGRKHLCIHGYPMNDSGSTCLQPKATWVAGFCSSTVALPSITLWKMDEDQYVFDMQTFFGEPFVFIFMHVFFFRKSSWLLCSLYWTRKSTYQSKTCLTACGAWANSHDSKHVHLSKV